MLERVVEIDHLRGVGVRNHEFIHKGIVFVGDVVVGILLVARLSLELAQGFVLRYSLDGIHIIERGYLLSDGGDILFRHILVYEYDDLIEIAEGVEI